MASDVQTTNDNIGTLRYKHNFSSNLSVADTLRYAHYEFDYQSNMPNFGATVPTAQTPLADILVGRDAPGSSGTQTNLTNQTDLTARFTTGPVSHTLFTGVEFARQTNDLSRYNTKTADLGPVKAKTYEAGAKTGWLDGMFSTTAAVFRTEVDNAQTNDPENPTLTVLNGDQRVDGVERPPRTMCFPARAGRRG